MDDRSKEIWKAIPRTVVFVYLPPSYARETTRRYPVVYFLHG